jgi:hypothetical protein
VFEQFFVLAFSPEQEFLGRERLFWSIHVALSFSWPCRLRNLKERKLVTTKSPTLKPGFVFAACNAIKQIYKKVK